MAPSLDRISPGFRIALFAKAMMLLAIAVLFVGLGFRIAAGAGLWPLRVLAGLFFAGLGSFVVWAAGLGGLDALRGRAHRAEGAVALQSRRSGYSLRLPDGRYVAAVRLYAPKVHTGLCWIDPRAGTLREFLTLPSGGDTSYAGLVWHDGLLWVSYYSSHEGKTSIYLAKVKVAR